jgi:hypothetical protein
MTSPKWTVIWGALLVYTGVLMLLESINSIQVSPWLWVALFLTGGVAFVGGYLERPAARWWAPIPAGAMLGLAAMIVWNHLGDGPPDRWGTTLFFAGIALGFLAVRAASSARWWAILPAGLALTLSLFIGLTSTISQPAAMAVFFLGIAATFAALALEPAFGRGPLRWPLLPAIVAAVLAAFFAFDAARRLEAFDVVWPLVLIAGGAYLIYRAVLRRPQSHST